MTSMTMTIPRQRSAGTHRAIPAPVVRRAAPWLDVLRMAVLPPVVFVAVFAAALIGGSWLVDRLDPIIGLDAGYTVAAVVAGALTVMAAIGGRR